MAIRAFQSVVPNSHQRQQSSAISGLDFAPCDAFTAPAVLPPDHPAMRPQLREIGGNKANTRASPRKFEEHGLDENKSLGEGTRVKRSASFKSFLPSKDTSKSPAKSPKKKTEKLGEKPLKKSKSSTSLSALLSRPRSSKGAKVEEARGQREKENQTPPQAANLGQPPPIWAQFATTATTDISSTTKVPLNDRRGREEEVAQFTPKEHSPSKQRNFRQPTLSSRSASKTRPTSEYLGSVLSSTSLSETLPGLRRSGRNKRELKAEREEPTPRLDGMPGSHNSACEDGGKENFIVDKRGSRVLAAAAFFNGKAEELPKEPVERPASAPLDSQAIESAFETLLDTRNVPYATRDKMRSLDTNIKADFIRQDKAGSGSASSTEGSATQHGRPATGNRSKTDDGILEHSGEQQATQSPKKSRPRSLTFTFNKGDQSPSKRQKSGSHTRTRSGEVTPSASSKSSTSAHLGHGVSLLIKTEKFALPEQVIAYLRRVPEPQSVEVGKVQKLRQLLRNETVGWVEAFITHGGMTEVVQLLYRTVAVEWRYVRVLIF